MRRINLESRYEQDAQDCMAIRDTLDLVHNADYPGRSDAARYARMAEDIVDQINARFCDALCPCPHCGDMDSRVTFSVDLDWRISCPACGYSVRAESWSMVQMAWESQWDAEEEGE